MSRESANTPRDFANKWHSRADAVLRSTNWILKTENFHAPSVGIVEIRFTMPPPSARGTMAETPAFGSPSVLAIRPGTKLSKTDRETLRSVGIVVISVAPEDVAAVQSVTLMPANEMLRCALLTIQSAPVGGYRPELLADFAKRVVKSYLELGEIQSLENSNLPSSEGA
jgi:hypothetical protein